MTLSRQAPLNIFPEIRALNFPAGQFIVVGSGILAAKGIRPAYDLDIVVTPELFEACRAAGWEARPWTKPGMIGKEWLRRADGLVDLMLESVCGAGCFDALELMKEGEVIDGIMFMSLPQLIRFKRDYGRPKDFEDIALIEKYLEGMR